MAGGCSKQEPGCVTALVPGAGLGRRIGEGVRKPFLEIGGKPVILWTLEALESVEAIGEIIPILRSGDMEDVLAIVDDCGLRKVRRIAPGGEERQSSVYNGLKLLKEPYPKFVLIHDAVRPFASRRLIESVIAAASPGIGAVPGLPIHDTVKRVDAKGRVKETLRRDALYAIQTPQVFPFEPIMRAHEEARGSGAKLPATDDASLLERLGGAVAVVAGETGNIKITTPEDLATAETILAASGVRFP